MQVLPVQCHYVSTSLVRSHSHITDIRLERAIHVYNQMACSLAHLAQQSSINTRHPLCHSVHVGQCRALLPTDIQRRVVPVKEKDADLPDSPSSLPIRLSVSSTSSDVPPVTPTLSISPRPSPRASQLIQDDPSTIPDFHFPLGLPQSRDDVDAEMARVIELFDSKKFNHLDEDNLRLIVQACGLPLYWKRPLFLAANKLAPGDGEGRVTREAFLSYWRLLIDQYHDMAARFVALLKMGAKRDYLLGDDLIPLVQDLIDTHPGLSFLADAPEFHARYVQTVIARVFYQNDLAWRGRLSMEDLRKSNFLLVLSSLESVEDINVVTDYFSYQHFYVIYCKFWELDLDHDLMLSREELAHHEGGALSNLVIDRILSGVVTHRRAPDKPFHMTYFDFIWFLLAEEDKQHPRSIEYWFRCMDLDGDGVLSMHELNLFYTEQVNRMMELGIEPIAFQDTMCQMLDMLGPDEPFRIRLRDLKRRSRLARIFFDTFLNLHKYLQTEQRDPFASAKEAGENPHMSDWERYAAEMYEILVAEELENANAQLV